MRRYILILLALPVLAVASCQNQDYIEADYNVRLSGANTYRAGEPVRFEISGNVDNLLFYSGENGHQYRYYNRYVVAPEDVRSAEFQMSIRPLYGYEGALDIYVSESFDGLNASLREVILSAAAYEKHDIRNSALGIEQSVPYFA